MERTTPAAERRLIEATKRSTLSEAIAWIAEGYSFSGNAQHLLQDLASLGVQSPDATRAAQVLARQASHSTFDSASILLQLDKLAVPARVRAAIDGIAARTSDHTLKTIDARSVLAAQREDPFTMEALCAVAGLSYSDLELRVAGLPSELRGDWKPSQISAAFAEIDAIVTGQQTTDLPGATVMRPLDLLPEIAGHREVVGWARVEDQRTRGVPYETLLAQRAAGGAWLQHRSATSSQLNRLVGSRLADALSDRGVSFRMSSSAGGEDTPSTLQKLAASDGQIGLLATDPEGRPRYAVAFSSARDSGTARKNVGALMKMKRDPALPMAVVVSGPGWSRRNETADLALAFGGRLYSDASIDALADDIAATIGGAQRMPDEGGRTR